MVRSAHHSELPLISREGILRNGHIEVVGGQGFQSSYVLGLAAHYPLEQKPLV